MYKAGGPDQRAKPRTDGSWNEDPQESTTGKVREGSDSGLRSPFHGRHHSQCREHAAAARCSWSCSRRMVLEHVVAGRSVLRSGRWAPLFPLWAPLSALLWQLCSPLWPGRCAHRSGLRSGRSVFRSPSLSHGRLVAAAVPRLGASRSCQCRGADRTRCPGGHWQGRNANAAGRSSRRPSLPVRTARTSEELELDACSLLLVGT
jgi:hypothetical protein